MRPIAMEILRLAGQAVAHAIVQLRECPVCRRVLALVYREFASADE